MGDASKEILGFIQAILRNNDFQKNGRKLIFFYLAMCTQRAQNILPKVKLQKK